jgi:hypothetical protein
MSGIDGNNWLNTEAGILEEMLGTARALLPVAGTVEGGGKSD